jgi:wyosine [tRNA(Phe)-imidazoG37] synthetase (radical SAM superfamily)
MYENNGEIWAKLDAGTERYYDRVDRTRVAFDTVTRNLRDAALRWPLVIQSLFMRISGEPPPAEEISAYAGILDDVLSSGGTLKLIQVHTVARPPAEFDVTALSDSEVDAIAVAVRNRLVDVPVETYYAPRPE